MRRTDREVHARKEIEKILAMCKTVSIAMVDEGQPYVIPMSYGYDLQEEELTLYFHSAKEGRKIDVLRKNNQVCFAIFSEGEAVHAETPCNSGYYFASVIGNGNVEFLEESEEKTKALGKMFAHQTGREVFFTKEQAETVCVFKIVSRDFSAKQKLKEV